MIEGQEPEKEIERAQPDKKDVILHDDKGKQITTPKTDEERAVEIWDRDSAIVASSTDEESEEYVEHCSQLLEKGDKKMAAYVGEVIGVVGYLGHVVQVASMLDGELKTMLRLALVLDDGTTTDTCSPSFVKGFAFLAKRKGPGPWVEPLRIRVKATTGRTGHDYYTCSAERKTAKGEKSPKPGKANSK